MRRPVLITALACAGALLVLLILWPQPLPPQDPAAVNDLLHRLESGQEITDSSLRYVVLDANGTVVTASAHAPEPDMWAAVRNRDTAVPVTIDGRDCFLILSNAFDQLDLQRPAWLAAVFICIAAVLMIVHLVWTDRHILRPFRTMKGVAEALARGDLDTPLPMDRGNVFGAFTESFDLMRTQLAHSRAAEAKLAQDRKELIAKLSHDLRTPIASIRAVAELGVLKAGSDADRRGYDQIAGKAAQLNLLVTNLLNASIEDQTRLSVDVSCVPSDTVAELLHAADYLHCLGEFHLPTCTVLADPVRLLQIFDNIVSNAYKYAPGAIRVMAFLQSSQLHVEIEDEGGGVPLDEVHSLRLRYYRGSNTDGIEGAGLGLHICSELLAAMGGEMLVENGDTGLLITICLQLAPRS